MYSKVAKNYGKIYWFSFILDFFKHLVQRVNILREILSIGQQSTFIPGALKIRKQEWRIRQTRNVKKMNRNDKKIDFLLLNR